MSAIDIAVAQLQQDEGLRLQAYPDPLSGGEPYTVGYGATGPDIGPSTVWTQEQADSDLQMRVMTLQNELMGAIPCYGNLDDVRQAVLLNAAYNLGLSGLLAFKHMIGYLQDGDYSSAAAELLASKAARQLPARYGRLATQMRNG